MKVCGGPILVCVLKVLKNIFYWTYVVHWYFMNYIYIYLCGKRVLSHTFDLVLYYLSAFQKYLFRKFQILVITHLTSGLTYPTYRYYKESIVCRRALLVGLPVFDVIDQITYLRLSIIILEIFRGVTNSWLKSCRTLMWVECGYRFYWETPRTIKYLYS